MQVISGQPDRGKSQQTRIRDRLEFCRQTGPLQAVVVAPWSG